MPDLELALARARGLRESHLAYLSAQAENAQTAADIYQQALIDKLKPGDVIFYATSTAPAFVGLDPDDFDKFDVLAAFVQAFPYVISGQANGWSPLPTDYKPWHHAAIVVAPEDGDAAGSRWMVGFNQPDWQGDQASLIKREEITLVDKQRITALRPPWWIHGSAIAQAAEAQVGSVTYSKKGLLAFMLASEARMTATASEREALFNIAHGMHVTARAADPLNLKHSCVTAAATAVEAAGVKLTFAEPPPPAPAALAVAMASKSVNNAALRAFKEINNQLAAAAAAAGTGTVAAALEGTNGATVNDFQRLATYLAYDVRDITVDDEAIADFVERAITAYSLNAGATELPPKYGGDASDGSIVADARMVLVRALETTNAVVNDGTAADLESLGAADRLTGLTANHLVASPAMLWDALSEPGGAEFLELNV